MTSTLAPARDPFRVVRDLDREWASLEHDAGEVDGWIERRPVLRGCRHLADVLAAVAPDPDGVLGALLCESAAGSARAARVVLQAMLGKVVLMAAADPATGVHAYLVAMWERIRTYPIERRPRHVSANLALDTRKLARVEGRTAAHITPWPPGASFAEMVERQRAREVVDHGRDIAVLTAGDIIKAALELELIDQDAGALLGTVYEEGLSSAEAARRHVTSPDMIRRRCSHAVRQLAAHSRELTGLV